MLSEASQTQTNCIFHLLGGIQKCVCMCVYVQACVGVGVCVCTQAKKGAGREENKNVREARLRRERVIEYM